MTSIISYLYTIITMIPKITVTIETVEEKISTNRLSEKERKKKVISH
jgi:translation initiation factor IF-1